MSATTVALAGIIALLVLLPARRLSLAGVARDRLVAYAVTVWLLGLVIAIAPGPARFLVPIVLVAYLAPFVTLGEGLERLRGRRGRPGPAGSPTRIKNVTPRDQQDG